MYRVRSGSDNKSISVTFSRKAQHIYCLSKQTRFMQTICERTKRKKIFVLLMLIGKFFIALNFNQKKGPDFSV